MKTGKNKVFDNLVKQKNKITKKCKRLENKIRTGNLTESKELENFKKIEQLNYEYYRISHKIIAEMLNITNGKTQRI